MVLSKSVSRQSLCLAGVFLGFVALTGCDESSDFQMFPPKDKAEASEPVAGQTTKLVERDVEAPDVFHVTEAGLWDGRPSLGGVWVAHPDVTDPERVIIRNMSNNKFVIGALFRREREIPGPRLQASSDAAAALGMIPGAPVQLDVTALRREAVPEEPQPLDKDTETASSGESTISDSEIAESTLDPIAGAAAAIEASAASSPQPATAPAPKPAKSSLSKPYIQIGIFSVEKNANHTANQMRSAGMTPTVFEQKANGKPFWRVVVGPAQSKSELNSLLKKVKKTGFSDAYAVTN